MVLPEDDQDPLIRFSATPPPFPFLMCEYPLQTEGHSFSMDLTLGPEECLCELGAGVLKDTSPLFFYLATVSPDLCNLGEPML